MVSKTVVVAAIAVTSAVAFPYLTALACNLVYGWPQTKHRYRRAFSPKKVFALNISIIQKIIISIRYASLYYQWKAFYKSARTSEIMKDRVFGRNSQKLDLYYPKSHSESGDTKTYPVVVFVYGGAWGSGDKNMYGLLCSSLANRLNAIVCCPNQSTYPKGYVDNMTQDILDAIIWLYQNIELYKGDKTKIMLVGHSSGAHLCALSMLELLRDGLGLSSAESLLPLSISGIQFSERHFDYSRNGNSDNDDRHSTGSSGSFYVISGQNDNGAQSAGLSSSPVLTADLVVTQKSETEFSEGSMLESELRALTEGAAGDLRYTRTASSDPGQEERYIAEADDEAEDDNNSMVTGKQVKGSVSSERSPVSDNGGHKSTEHQDSTDIAEADDEGEDDNNSIVTVKQTEGADMPAVFDTQPTRAELCRSLKAVIGIAGVYHIGDHFIHESGRGIEDLSSMARAMRGSKYFDRFSPTHILRSVQQPASIRFPKMILLHGTEDYVVPLNSSIKFSEELKRHNADVTVRIIPSCDHYEICLDLMKPSCRFHDTVIGVIETTAKSVFAD